MFDLEVARDLVSDKKARDKDSRDREYQIGKYKKSGGFWDMLRF